MPKGPALALTVLIAAESMEVLQPIFFLLGSVKNTLLPMYLPWNGPAFNRSCRKAPSKRAHGWEYRHVRRLSQHWLFCGMI